ncbi:MAG TPA: T9SS type A sorting domain-containing protein [Candidatus Cloacimonadota bacterium]|nr:T9SS type A sorting domain-containing protein [Candidatus Cloacimonadota bacterium]
MKHVFTILLLISISLAFAQPEYYPLTSIAETFSTNWCTGCQEMYAGINVLHDQMHAGEFISTRLYTESGPLSNDDVQARFDHYGVVGFPTVIFNGKARVDGANDETHNGQDYLNAMKPYRFAISPLKMQITAFNRQTGAISVNVQMVSSTFNLQNANLILYLLEDDVTDIETHVTRQVIQHPITLSGAGNSTQVDKTFTISADYDTTKLWAAAFVQLADDNIVQTAHTLALPEHHIRAAFNWDATVVSPLGEASYLSQPFWVFNLGVEESINTRIVVDEGPDNWYFNYCDEDDNCYPGSIPMPHTLVAGEIKGFHLNIMLSGSGIARFRFVISSDSLGEYSIPFVLVTDDLDSDDHVIPNYSLNLKANYPNPFSANTSIVVEAQKTAGDVVVDIYNIKGQKVDSLELRQLSDGSNEMVWSPSKDLPAGVYLQKIRGTNLPARRMMYIK